MGPQPSSPNGWRTPPARWDVHAVFMPERPFDIDEEAKRLRGDHGRADGVNLFISEGAGVSEIVAAMEAAGEEVPRDPFGHVQLDKINPGQWFAKQFAAELGADKVLVQKSGYSRARRPPNAADLALIRECTNYAVDAALRGESGVVGQDEERGDELRAIEFERIAGGKAFDPRCRGSPTCCATSARPEAWQIALLPVMGRYGPTNGAPEIPLGLTFDDVLLQPLEILGASEPGRHGRC